MLNEKGFNGALKTIKASGEKLAEAIHDAGLFAISQANEHGNIGFASRLVEAMGKKHDARRVVVWLCHFGKIGVQKGAIVYKKRKDIAPENYDAWLVKANDTPYWELTKQAPLVEKVDYLSMLKGIISKHKKMQEMENNGKQVSEINLQVVDEVEKLLAKFTKPSEVKPAAPALPAPIEA